MRERALDKYRREHPHGVAAGARALAGSLKGNKNVYRANSLGRTTSAAAVLPVREESERRKMALVLRGWREGGGGTDNRMNFEWSITPHIRTRAPPRGALVGVEKPPSILLENGKYFSAYTSQRI